MPSAAFAWTSSAFAAANRDSRSFWRWIMKRVMCVYLPRWPLQRRRHVTPECRDKPVVIAQARLSARPKVLLCCDRAAQAGIRADMPLAEARAILPDVVVFDDDPERDRRALERLAEWAERYSPIVGLEEDPAPRSLLLDITGCAAYFGGEDRLAQRAVRELQAEGWIARVAIADTIGAAWGLAHLVRQFFIVPPGETERTLMPLPITAIRLPPEAIDTLKQLGIERVSQLAELPREGVPGRFGSLVLERLDQALGRRPELIVPHRAVPEVQAGFAFEYATERRQALLYALDQLLERVEKGLRDRHRGARRVECWFYHETAAPVRVEVNLFRSSHSAVHIGRLLRTRLESVRFTEPVSAMCVRVPVVEKIGARQFELYETEEPRLEELSVLIDRLVSRLGREAVTLPTLVADPQPEYGCRFEPALSFEHAAQASAPMPLAGAACSGNSAGSHAILRPLQLWPQPQPIDAMAVFPEGAPHRFCRG